MSMCPDCQSFKHQTRRQSEQLVKLADDLARLRHSEESLRALLADCRAALSLQGTGHRRLRVVAS